jgi:hypothetical protein
MANLRDFVEAEGIREALTLVAFTCEVAAARHGYRGDRTAATVAARQAADIRRLARNISLKEK